MICVWLAGWIMCHLARSKWVPKRLWGSRNKQIQGTRGRKEEGVLRYLERLGLASILLNSLYPLGCLPGSQSGIKLFMFESFVLWLKPAAEPLYRVRTGLSWVEGRDLTRAGPQSSWFQALQEVGVHSDGGSVFTSAFIFPVSAGQTENLINCVKPKQAWMLKDIK